jgi:hypothetical protein
MTGTRSSGVPTISTRRCRSSVGGVPSYLVETYLPRGDVEGRLARWRRACSAAEELTQEGTPVRFDRTVYVPEDEICFFVFDAPSGREAVRAAERARLDPFRVVEAVSTGKEQQ